MNRADRIALLARRFRLLADRPDLLRRDPAEHVATATAPEPVRLNLLDAVQVAGVGDLDRLCAAGVRRLGSSRRGRATVLDLLAELEPDRLLAVYYALPEDQRSGALRDGVWAYHVNRAPAGVE